MRPILVSWNGLRIHSYPALLYVGMALGMVAGSYAASVSGLDPGRVVVAIVLLTIPALVGARLLFVATHWRLYRNEPRRILRRTEGGAAMQGGLPLALLVSVPLLAALEIPVGAFWDVATFTALIALIFARLGCLLHGCCAGRPTTGLVGLDLPDHRGIWRRRVPTQLLDAGWAALVMVGAAGLWSVRPFPGAVFLAALGAYALGRFVLEPTREGRVRLGALDLQRALAVASGLTALAGLVIAWLASGEELQRATTTIEWSVLLTPLILLPLILPFVFVGCELDTAGTLEPLPTRPLHLHYTIPKVTNNQVTHIRATFTASANGVSEVAPVQTPSPPPPEAVNVYDPDSDGTFPKETGAVSLKQFDKDDAINCECAVTLTLAKAATTPSGWTYSEITRTGTTPQPTKNAVLDFKLGYAKWPNVTEAEYDPTRFSVFFDQT
jgi:phosphatidylglycerol---prolipoprotein diacylglyceryl transferase